MCTEAEGLPLSCNNICCVFTTLCHTEDLVLHCQKAATLEAENAHPFVSNSTIVAVVHTEGTMSTARLVILTLFSRFRNVLHDGGIMITSPLCVDKRGSHWSKRQASYLLTRLSSSTSDLSVRGLLHHLLLSQKYFWRSTPKTTIFHTAFPSGSHPSFLPSSVHSNE